MFFRRLLGLFCLLLSVSSALAESEGDTLAFPCSPELSPFSLKANTPSAARLTCITGIACRLITGAMTPSPSITVL